MQKAAQVVILDQVRQFAVERASAPLRPGHSRCNASAELKSVVVIAGGRRLDFFVAAHSPRGNRLVRTSARVRSARSNDMPEKFVHKQNIERYRKLLLETTDEVRRQQILKLLAEEEAKDAPPPTQR